jgi:anhydro-N-acetylmuramic acid kinase
MKNKLKIIGLMSGTSLDGLDIAYVCFTFSANNIKFELLNYETVSYNDSISSKLKVKNNLSLSEMLMLDKEIGGFFGDKVNDFIEKYGIDKNEIDAIASHGQTMLHQPENGFTSQIGCGSTISYKTGITVINDFRTRDVIVGGQGAPLVPIGDFNLFSEFADSFLNIGGFTNISFKQNKDIIAFDISPGNLPLNILANKLGYDYDSYGDFARKGNVINDLLDRLNSITYYNTEGPKSLGTEWLDSEFIPIIEEYESIFDTMRTITEHIAFQIALILKKERIKSIYITGGGAKNTFLIERISNYYDSEIIIPSKEIIDFKEAIVFAFLGARYLRNEPTTIASVTGAKRDICSGVLHIPGF